MELAILKGVITMTWRSIGGARIIISDDGIQLKMNGYCSVIQPAKSGRTPFAWVDY